MTLTPFQSWLLTAIRTEGPISTGTLKSDCRCETRAGVPGLDENHVFRDLAELQRLGLVADMPGGWLPVYPAETVKPKQREMFA